MGAHVLNYGEGGVLQRSGATLQGRQGRESHSWAPPPAPPGHPTLGPQAPTHSPASGLQEALLGATSSVLTGLLSFSTEMTLECPGRHRRRPNPDQVPEPPEGFVIPLTMCRPTRNA